MPYIYDPELGQWLNQDGDPLTDLEMAAFLDEIEKRAEDDAIAWVLALAAGGLFLDAFLRRVFDLIQEMFVVSYSLGVGGIDRLSSLDGTWSDILSNTIATQFVFAQRFATDIRSGRLSQAQIEARLRLYIRASRQAYWMGRSHTAGLVLPAYPRDGSSECLSNDRCYWRIVEYPDRWDAFWELTPAEHCETCLTRSRIWYPYTVYK